MSRGHKRNQRRRTPLNTRNASVGPDPTQESAASKKYTAGQTVKYRWRIAGPISPVTTSRLENTE